MALRNLISGTVDVRSLGFDLGTLVLRGAGLLMAFAHGLSKMPPSEKFIAGVTTLGFPMPFVFAWCAGLSEFIGGIFLAIGLFVRPSAAALAFTMGVAAFLRHAEDSFKMKEPALLYFTISMSLVFLGGGRFSIDSLIRKR